MQHHETQLHIDLQQRTAKIADQISGPTIGRSSVIDHLLDFRNLGGKKDLGLELTVDEMLETLPPTKSVSSEWWLGCLSDIADHAAFLAAGYPPASPELLAA